ncbi:MAG TPA: methionine aminotransferase [Vicinamibacterales bacterium]|nr:methionine aminotransferase [Vicinamibacterales bacterium]
MGRVGPRVRIQPKLPSGGVSIFAVMTRLANEHGAINLSQGFPDYNCDPALIDAVARYMREGHNQYAPMPGVLALREALAMKIERLYGRRYDPATEITVTTGATEGIFNALTALVHPGDEVLLFQPAYDSYTPSVVLSGGIPRYTTVRYPDYRIDWDDVRRQVSSRTRAIVVNTPHNPTGMIWTADDVAELRRVLQGTDAIVISDEVYEHITFDGHPHESLARHPDIAERAIVISSFGKTYHTTGWKVGYCAASPELTREIQGIHQWVTFAVNGAVQMAYADMVNRDPSAADVTAFYQGRRDLFLSLIAGSRFKPLPCRGTFFQLVDYSGITTEGDVEFAQRLTREHGVAAIPISPFLNDNEQPGPVVRFCFAKRDETLKAAAERLRRV